MTFSKTPDTPAELISSNTETTPEEIWERVIDLEPSDLQVFTWNCVNRLHKFHELYIKSLLEDKDTSPEDLGSLPLWIKDKTIYESVLELLKKVSD